MKKAVVVVLLLAFVQAVALADISKDSLDLHPKEHYSKEASLMIQILNTYHFKKITLNDSLSSIILDEYLKVLDNNHSYFLASDIDTFEKYRTNLDDLSSLGEIDFAFEIYNVFRRRFNQRMSYVRDVLLDRSYDFTIDEYYDTDRSKISWARDEGELNELWRKVIKSQILNLKLNGKEDADIRETMEKRYRRFQKNIDQYTSEDVFELYMNTLAEAYDPHTNYFSPRTSDRFRQNMSLSLEGIGARLMTDNDFTKVAQVMPGGPAEKSKMLQENDLIVGVGQGTEGEIIDVIGWRIDDVVQLIKGPKGTTVRLEILEAEKGVNGPSKVITLVREKIKIEDMEAKSEIINFEKDGRPFRVGVITLPGFYMDFQAYQNGDPDYNSTTRDVRRLVLELKDQGIDGLMMDLRNNGGGSLAEAIDLTGLFIKNGPVVQIKTSSNKIEVGEDEDPDVIWNGPLAVMINRFSASASEIFAGAIQDYQRGVVVGEQTFGKGTVQSVIDLSKYIDVPQGEKVGQLKLTLQKFYRITGSSTQNLGVSPDIDLPSAFEASEFGESASPSALAWDEIGSASYKLIADISPELIAKLNSSYEDRLVSDIGLKELAVQANELKESLARTKISLNEEKRKQEMDEDKTDKSRSASLSGGTVDAESKISSELQISDQYLKEGIIILSNVIRSIG